MIGDILFDSSMALKDQMASHLYCMITLEEKKIKAESQESAVGSCLPF